MSNGQTALQKVWLITGAGAGLGASLASAVLARGDKVIITGRPGSKEKMQEMVDALPDNERDENRIRLLELDVTDTTENISSIVKTAVDFWGRIDVLVNNAGIVVPGITEEQGVRGWERQFRTNVFGVINVTNAVLPYMRAKRDGTVVILGSRSAWKNDFPVSPYSASKAAIHSYADTLSAEVGIFNIRVLNLAPAAFRTSGFDPPKPIVDHIDDYDPIRLKMAAIVKERRERSTFGDPRKGMEIVVDVVRGEGRAAGREWPSLLFLGGDALADIREKMHRWEHDLDAWSDVAQDVTEDK
ncbi:NAD-P-binding protein [Dentipellis sp. KUC8613]|nr:NAD-P-binding protein [Dentipellis sp. KUC8613]